MGDLTDDTRHTEEPEVTDACHGLRDFWIAMFVGVSVVSFMTMVFLMICSREDCPPLHDRINDGIQIDLKSRDEQEDAKHRPWFRRLRKPDTEDSEGETP